MLKWVEERAKERSTWVAIISMLGIFGVTVEPEMAEQIASVGAMAVAAIFAATKG